MIQDKLINNYKICIILVCPEHPNNIGAVARAMNNMGVSELRLVNPCSFLNHGDNSARSLAMHSQDILENAKTYSSLAEAITDKKIIIGTTNRQRGHHKYLHSIWKLEPIFNESMDISFVFGRESSGLTNAEIDLCSHILTIPTFGTTNSLNLAQAVMVVLYETSKIIFNYKNNVSIHKSNIASSQHIETLKSNLFTLLHKINYIKIGNHDKKRSAFSKIIAEKKLSTKEVNILQGIIQKAEKKIDSIMKQR